MGSAMGNRRGQVEPARACLWSYAIGLTWLLFWACTKTSTGDSVPRQVERRAPSQKVRVAAARLRVSSDRQASRARETPLWIKELAQSGAPRRQPRQ